ncbi:CotH kinase family protein [Larkinella arboricola]
MKNIFSRCNVLVLLVMIGFFGPLASHTQAQGTPPSISLPAGRFQVDHSLGLIVCNSIPTVSASQPASTLVLDKTYTLSPSLGSIRVGTEYHATDIGGKTYKLYFTKLPLVHIRTNSNAVISESDDRTPGSVVVTETDGEPFSASMGIRVRGNLSRTYPKRSYNMQLWKDATGSKELETALLGMRNDSKWLLQALYSEPLRLNSAVSWSLWQRIHTLYYSEPGFPDGEPGALSAVRSRYCDVFLNGSYIGIYGLGEDMDRKQLKLKKTGDQGELNGELYKASGWSDATTFSDKNFSFYDPNSVVWAEYEMDYPKEPYWNNLYDFVNFVVTEEPSKLKAGFPSRLNLDNMIDYFLFLNVTGAKDNIGNNQFIARYKQGEPYLFIPWDLDGTFGYWNGSYIHEIDPDMGVLINGLFDRLLSTNPHDYKGRMRQRWFSLRQNEFSAVSLKKNFTDSFNLLNNNGAYARENLKWASSLRMHDMDYIHDWIDRRLLLLDKYFSEFPLPKCTTPATPTVTATPASLSAGQTTVLKATGCAYTVIWNTGQTGAQISVTPPITTGYFAKCQQAAGCESPFSAPVEVKVSPAAPPANQPPRAPVLSPLQTTVHTAFAATLPAFTDTDPLTYSLKGLPEGLNFTAASRQIAGTPTVSGTYSLTYTATDSKSASTSAFVPLTVHPAPPGSVTGNFEGYLDIVGCSSIQGWVWDRSKPNTPLMVEFFANGKSIGTVEANLYRQDLKDTGKGNGMHGYRFTTPASIKTGATFQISAEVQNSTYVLNWAPKALTCPVASVESGEGLSVWPNPSNGNFEVQYRLNDGPPGELSVLDGTGRRWYWKVVGGVGDQRQSVSLPGASGMYLIQLRQGKTVQTRKVLIGK